VESLSRPQQVSTSAGELVIQAREAVREARPKKSEEDPFSQAAEQLRLSV
jgi:hypothetical protein